MAEAGNGKDLRRNERLVLDALRTIGGPLRAYQLLERLACNGVRSPMTVYRALDRLEASGLVHKLDRLGAYIACQKERPHEVEVFLVCRVCASVTEIDEETTPAFRWEAMERGIGPSGFRPYACRIEFLGQCCEPDDRAGR